ncbi:MAG TPA: T9SS type A sorting domain-containing protein [Flavipsychrobacter sp.]
MKKIISLCFLLALAFTSQAQLVNSLNFSTGYDNVSGTTIPLGQQDPEWLITALGAPFAPSASYPYGAYVQSPWGPGYSSPPTTPAGTEWVSYSPNSMSTGEYDDIGGTITLQYNFETCSEDYISFSAVIRSDNGITDLRVDGVSTGFTQNVMNNNWMTGSSFTYANTLPAGMHTVEVDVKNVGVTQPNNPAGLNVDGNITSVNNSIIDRANYPDYTCCNAHFTYCSGTLNPYQFDFSAVDPSQPGNYEWYVNGAHVGSGAMFSYVFAGPGSYQVCMSFFNPATGSECMQCMYICVPDNPIGAGEGSQKIGRQTNINTSYGNSALEVAKVYPNPASSEINVEFGKQTNGKVSVRVFDMMGKVVLDNNVTLKQGQQKLTLSAGSLPAGLYLLHISDGVTVIKEQVVIEK